MCERKGGEGGSGEREGKKRERGERREMEGEEIKVTDRWRWTDTT